MQKRDQIWNPALVDFSVARPCNCINEGDYVITHHYSNVLRGQPSMQFKHRQLFLVIINGYFNHVTYEIIKTAGDLLLSTE